MKTFGMFTLIFGLTVIPGFAQIVVTTTTDTIQIDGQCSLREAILTANDNVTIDSCDDPKAKYDQILLPGGIYEIEIAGASEDEGETGDFDILGNLTIEEITGKVSVIIDGGSLDRVFHVMDQVSLTLTSMTIRNGDSTAAAGPGGCIRSDGALHLDDVVVSSCSGVQGGGIAHFGSGVLEIENSHILSNQASGHGGGIFDSQSYNAIILTDSTIRDNQAGDDAGGVLTRSITMRRSTVSGNSAGRNGGGLYWPSDAGSLSSAVNSTIAGNTAASHGGGFYVGGAGRLELSSVTVIDNTADVDGNDDGDGGGIYIPSTAEVRVRNTIVADNTDLSTGMFAAFAPDCAGSFDSYGYNLFGAPGAGICTLSGSSGDQVGSIGSAIDPQLGALAPNGGQTQTCAPEDTSPVIDAGNPAGCFDHGGVLLTIDQAGRERSTDGPDADGTATCDIGAYETAFDFTIFVDGFETGGAANWSVMVN